MQGSYKKLSIALLALGISGLAVAGGYEPQAGYHFGLEFHYLHPHNDTDVMRFARTVGTTEHKIHVATFDWEWGFNLEGAYHDGEGNDFKLEWTYLDDSKETSKAEDSNSVGPPPHVRTFYNNGINFHTVKGSVSVDFHQINLEIGHTFDSHHGFTARLHAGLAYADLDKDIHVHGFDSVGFLTYKTEYCSDFDGIGLRTGADFDWAYSDTISLFARAAVALYHGDIDTHTFIDDNTISENWTHKIRTHPSEETIVPEFQARVGVSWRNDNWTINLGWRHDVFVHAEKFVFTESNPVVRRDGYVGDYAHGGPFLGVVWKNYSA